MINNKDIDLQDLIYDETFKLLFNMFNDNSESKMSSEAFLRIVTIDLYHFMKHSLDRLWRRLGVGDTDVSFYDANAFLICFAATSNDTFIILV